jgi:small-conductance mechanosensitive channel
MEFPHTVNNQEEFDALINQRLERARQKWESEGGVAEAQQQAREAESRADAAEHRARERIATRDARSLLSEMGVADAARQQRILRLADLDSVGYDEAGEPNAKDLRDALKAVHKDIPEVFGSDVQVVDSPADAGGDQLELG